MNTHDDNKADSLEPPQPIPTEPTAQPVDQGRRHFTRAGLVVSGAILTLKSAPVLAGKAGPYAGIPTNITYQECASPSGFTSMNVSAPGKTQPLCGGLSPGAWAAWPEYWPAPYVPGTCTKQKITPAQINCAEWDPNTGTPFHSMYSRDPGGAGVFSGSHFGQASLMALIAYPDQYADPDNLGRHCAASILNVAKGLVPTTVLTIDVIQDMWTSCSNGGTYSPAPGVNWNAKQVVDYLLTTFG